MYLCHTVCIKISTNDVLSFCQIEAMFDEISGEQRVQTIGHKPLDMDSVVIDYSLQSIGNSDMRYLAGVMQPAITSGNIAGASLASNDVSFIPISGMF